MSKTWILDLDGTIVKHNGYKTDGKDTVLDGVKEFLNKLPKDDFIVIITARESKFKEQTLKFLGQNGIRFNYIIFDAPKGERILINDIKPEGMKTAVALNIERDNFPKIDYTVDSKIQQSKSKLINRKLIYDS